MTIVPKAISIKIPKTFFTEIEINPKIHMETQKTLNNQSNPESKEQTCESITVLDFKLHYGTTVTKIWY
jgi:hypothetical protein